MVTGGYLGWVSNLLREGVDGLGGSYFFSILLQVTLNTILL